MFLLNLMIILKMRIRTFLAYLLLLFISLLFFVDCANKKMNDKESGENSNVQLNRDISENQLSPEEREKGWHLLFDGNSLENWREFQGEGIPQGWRVDSGSIYLDGASADIVSKQEFSDFHLKLEWKIEEGGNSGIMYHVLEGGYPASWATGPEYQLIDDIGYQGKLESWQCCGANYAMHAPVNARIKPAMEWNSSQLIVKNRHVKHYLNGELILEFDLRGTKWEEKVQNSKWAGYSDYGKAESGLLALQSHGSRIWFKNIKILEL